jgi:hypothetical protein
MFNITVHDRIYSRERVEYGLASVHGNSGQRENADGDGQHVYERAKGAHERRQIPTLQQSSLKLKDKKKKK